MELKNNIAGWFEIPVADMDRAVKFYEQVFSLKLFLNELGELQMAWFPWVDKGMGAGGSLVKHDFYKPSADGVVIYLSSIVDDVSVELSRVAQAGGKVIMEKKQISAEHGYMGVFLDSEGNRIALHSRN